MGRGIQNRGNINQSETNAVKLIFALNISSWRPRRKWEQIEKKIQSQLWKEKKESVVPLKLKQNCQSEIKAGDA